ncbi:hypothetical protein GWC77_26100 [Paraburkholderia sp. NMBU_R16]|uniref:hypothetical protein n=1 Tax=Paraburkholderia sp. NMBU_R16 TaxID=2698676 RepID=UPI00156557EF|nr:hypothetical protein [Paraburkholderia sp. NMBU_R16]NRO99359.1 hypothetical protein [Paraburkholderia sp. NMBU_R16]
MASVKIDLGFGEQAILSATVVSAIPMAKHQWDAEEFLRRWPRTRSVHQARGYLRELGLHVAYTPAGVNPSDAIALLRSAVKSGRVTVAIERAARRFGGGLAAAKPTWRSGQIEPSRKSFAEMGESGRPVAATLGDAVSAPKSYSWMQSYDDVSADDLIKYLESVVASTRAKAAAPDADPPTPLGEGELFALGASRTSDNLMSISGRAVSEEHEAECFEQYERDLDMCHALGSPMGGARGLALCKQQAFINYQQCRGY